MRLTTEIEFGTSDFIIMLCYVLCSIVCRSKGGDEDEDICSLIFFLFFFVPPVFFGLPKKGGSHLEGDGDGDADAEKACATVMDQRLPRPRAWALVAKSDYTAHC